MRRVPALSCLALALAGGAPPARAQDAMDMSAMPGMHHHATPDTHTHASGAGKDHVTSHPDHTHAHPAVQTPTSPSAPPMQQAHAHDGHAMGSAQGGKLSADARDPDYSDGMRIEASHGMAMAMDDDPAFPALHVDHLEGFQAHHGDGQQWDVQGGYGSSRDRLWLRTEGERTRGRIDHADIELLWRHAVAPFWDTQLGMRTDAGAGPDRQWAALGIQGLAPYWFELEATGYLGPAGRTAARLRADYELLFTQRLVLEPELELNAYGKADPARGLGSGLSDAALGLRLRYEIRRELAPYVGVVWTRRFGGTADQGGLFDRRWVAGVRIRL